MKEWDKYSLLRIFKAVDLELLKECLQEMELEIDGEIQSLTIKQMREINDFLVSLIPWSLAKPLNFLFQEGLDWLLSHSGSEELDLEDCKDFCKDSIEQAEFELSKLEGEVVKMVFQWGINSYNLFRTYKKKV